MPPAGEAFRCGRGETHFLSGACVVALFGSLLFIGLHDDRATSGASKLAVARHMAGNAAKDKAKLYVDRMENA